MVTKSYRWAKRRADQLLKIDFIRFGIVGVGGFSVSFILLFILHGQLGLEVTLATLLANEGGLLSNFVFHETWTYKHVDHSHKSLGQKFVHFHMSSWSGIALILIIVTVLVHLFQVNYLVAQAIASGLVMFWNFFWTKYFIFKGRTPDVLLHPEDTTLPDEN